MGQRVQLGSGRGVVHSGTKTNSNLQTEVKQGIRWGIGGEAAQARKGNPGCLGDTAENASEFLGAMPTTVNGWPLIEIARPAMDESALKRSRHRASERTIWFAP
jgi:hypothetical protein